MAKQIAVTTPVTVPPVTVPKAKKAKAVTTPVVLPPAPVTETRVALNCSKCGQGRLTTEVRKNLGGALYCKGCYYPEMHARGLSPRWTALQAQIAAAEAAKAQPVVTKKTKKTA